MAHLNGFNANDVDPSTPRAPIPADRYLAVITESERKPAKSGNGSELLMVVFTVQGGAHDKRTIKNHLNLWNVNTEASRIAWGDMSAICRAVGIMQPNDTTDLHNIPLEIDVGVGAPNDRGQCFNEIKGYYSRQPMAAVSEPECIPGEDSNQAPAADKMPWE